MSTRRAGEASGRLQDQLAGCRDHASLLPDRPPPKPWGSKKRKRKEKNSATKAVNSRKISRTAVATEAAGAEFVLAMEKAREERVEEERARAERAKAMREKARAAAGYVLPPFPMRAKDNVGEGDDSGSGRDKPKEKVSYLSHFGVPLGSDEASRNCRSRILAEVIRLNERDDTKHEFCSSNSRPHRLIKVPTQRLRRKARMKEQNGETETVAVWLPRAAAVPAVRWGEPAATSAAPAALSTAAPGPEPEPEPDRAANDDDYSEFVLAVKAEQFIETSRRTGFMTELLLAVAWHCHGSEEDAVEIMLHYFAKKHFRSYAKYVNTADEEIAKDDKKNRKYEIVELPPGFKHFDGGVDVLWNIRYMELKKYKEENGDCLVPVGCRRQPSDGARARAGARSSAANARGGGAEGLARNPLGNWVSTQRSSYKNKSPALTPKRIELLNDLGFVWDCRPNPGQQKDPRFSRAMAARLHYTDLTLRQCMLLGGYEEDELDEVPNPKHTWRTIYVCLKDRMNARVKKWDDLRSDKGIKADVLRMVGKLKSDRYMYSAALVFKEKASLLSGFLLGAAESERGVEEGVEDKKEEEEKVVELTAMGYPSRQEKSILHNNVERYGRDRPDTEHFWTKRSRVDQSTKEPLPSV